MMLDQKFAQPGDIDHTSAEQDNHLEADENSFEEALQLKYQREIAIKLFILALTGYILKAMGALAFYPLVWIPILLPPTATLLIELWKWVRRKSKNASIS